MIQFNLLPDVKLEYIKAQRAKRMVLLISAISGGATVTIFMLLFLSVNVFQKTHINNLTKDIADERIKLNNIKDLDKILTVQNQLGSLTALHDQKPETARLFTYIPQLVPKEISIADLTLNFTDATMKITGSADALSTVNKFADTLKFTQYKTADSEPASAFSDVVLTQFARSQDQTSFTIDLKFDPAIFDSKKNAQLTVPTIISSRSETEKPSEDLFKELIKP